MKKLLPILALFICMPCFGALTKTTAIDEVDAWQAVTAGTLVTGTSESVSTSYSTTVYIEIALIEAVASDGCEGFIEVSYGDNVDWVLYCQFKGTAETPATTTTVGAISDSNTAIRLTDSATGDFDVVGRKWFIKDGTIGNSESVRTKSNSSNVVTLCSDVLRAHDAGVNVYDRVDEWVYQLPMSVSRFRVCINNVDADCDAAFTVRKSIVTGL